MNINYAHKYVVDAMPRCLEVAINSLIEKSIKEFKVEIALNESDLIESLKDFYTSDEGEENAIDILKNKIDFFYLYLKIKGFKVIEKESQHYISWEI